MSKSEQTITIRGASASRSKSTQEVLDIERRIIDDLVQARILTFNANPCEAAKLAVKKVAVCMSDSSVETLILDLLEWINREERTYAEVMDAWRTSCPRFPIWEEASDRGLIATTVRDKRRVVNVTSAGVALLEMTRPSGDRP